jgi:putative FmdB family regulatory protein
MPTYDLVCDGCEHRFEAFRQGFLRDEDRACPQCGAADARQLFTGFVTARPPKAAVASGGGGCCGGGCGCGH